MQHLAPPRSPSTQTYAHRSRPSGVHVAVPSRRGRLTRLYASYSPHWPMVSKGVQGLQAFETRRNRRASARALRAVRDTRPLHVLLVVGQRLFHLCRGVTRSIEEGTCAAHDGTGTTQLAPDVSLTRLRCFERCLSVEKILVPEVAVNEATPRLRPSSPMRRDALRLGSLRMLGFLATAHAAPRRPALPAWGRVACRTSTAIG